MHKKLFNRIIIATLLFISTGLSGAGISIQPENGTILLQIPFTSITDYPISIKYNPLIEKGSVGAKWQCSLDTEFQFENGSPLYLVRAYCSEYLFFKDIVGNFTSSPGAFATLEFSNGNYIMSSNNGEKLTFDDTGALKTIQDRAGKTAEFEKNSAGKISGWRIKTDTIENFSSDALFKSGEKDGLASGGSAVWDDHGLLESISNNGITYDFTYRNDKIASVKLSSGQEWLFEYDEAGRLYAISEPDHLYFISYWADGKVKTVNDILGDSIYAEYVKDADDNITSIWNLSNYTLTNYKYIPNKILVTRGPIDGETDMSAEINLETNHRLVTAKNGDRIEFIPQTNGEIEIVSAIRGYMPFTTRMNFNETIVKNIDSFECFREVSSPTDFDLVNSRDKIKGNGLISDLNKNVLEVIQKDINVARFLYSKQNTVREMILPYGGKYNFEYDLKNRVTQVTAPYSRITRYSYDDKNNEACIELPDSEKITVRYDGYGDPVEIQEPLGRTTLFTYFARGDIGSVEMKDFDTQSLLFSGSEGLMTYNSNLFGQYLFQDDFGGKLTRVAPDGTVANFEITNKNITKILDNDSKAAAEYTYNEFGEITSAASPASDVLFGYDEYGRLASKSFKSAGLILKYHYNKEDMVSGISDSKGFNINYMYDDKGNLKEIKNDKAGTFTIGYGLNGMVNSIDLPNGIRILWNFDQASNICEYGYKMKSGKIVSNKYSYDNMGNVSSLETSSGNSVKYSYDSLGHLSGIKYSDGKSADASYDKWGNIQTLIGKKIAYAKPGLPDKINDDSIKCDDSGRITEYSEGKNNYKFSYDWNNRINKLELNGKIINEWLYGPLDDELVVSYQSDVKTRYFFTGRNLYANQDMETGELTRYIFLPGVNIPLAIVRPDGKVDYPLCDAQGTIVYLTDSSGSITEQRKFDIFGNLTGKDNMNIPLGFAGGLGFDEGRILFLNQSQYFVPLQRRISRTGVMPGEFNLDFNNTLSFLNGNPLTLINRNR